MPTTKTGTRPRKSRTGTTRFNFIINDEVNATFDKAQQAFDLKNKVDVLRYALSVLDVMAEEIPKGNRIVIQAPDGTLRYEIIAPKRNVMIPITEQERPST